MRLRWQLGRAGLPREVRDLMSSSESQFFSEYDSIVTEYSRKMQIDLSAVSPRYSSRLLPYPSYPHFLDSIRAPAHAHARDTHK